MIAVEIMGGLGNQMFQFASARALALHRNEKFLLDKHFFDNYELHNYSLHHFNIKTPLLEENISFEPINFIEKVKAFLLKKKIFSIYEEKELIFNKNLFTLPQKNIYLKGYFQSEKYFIKYEEQIREDFKIISLLKKETTEILKIINTQNSISLHIRRGDYVNNPVANLVHGTCDLNYYYKAITIIKEKIENPVFFIFSDDINWAKENLKIEDKIYFVDFNDASTNYEDLKLMSSCKHNIIANSSFSWWGAWLNNNKNKIVIAPNKWFNVDYHNATDIIPESWLKI
ncbi:alpha-1,2-fucosyltransferase [Halpernia sp.]|uniref:alpha-1,2-fucosyltransferase n=1 Tax=Halpernia sp. TaxID=2782209 RepID=UPI003A93717F